MKTTIIQSFAYYDEGNPYLYRHDEKLSKTKAEYIKNFYSFLLSYATIKKYAGPVTMVCNKKAYDTLLKYIPYDNFYILENKRNFNYWSIYKVDAMMEIKGDVLHVDPDIMIFDRLFDSFLNGEVETILQNKMPPQKNFLDEFVIRYEDFLIKNNILDLNKYDKASACTAVFGLKEKHKDIYYKTVELIYDEMNKGEMHARLDYHNPIVVEELMWYLLSLKLKLKTKYVLPPHLTKQFDEREVGDMVKYTHLWLGTRFQDSVLDLVKNKIMKEFPEYLIYMKKFENIMLKEEITD